MNAEQAIKDWNNNYGYSDDDIELIKKMRSGGLTDEQIAIALNAIEDTCPHCWDAEKGCQCWNDE
jgi:hypothetical protein